MERLTKDNPQENFETMMNYVFAKDGWAHIRHDGESEDVPLTAWAKAQCIKRGCDEFPGETAEEIDETLCDCLMDGEGCQVALAYCFACQASHLRDRLNAIEDILGDEYNLDRLRELTQAEKDGRLVVLPCKVGDTLYWADIYMRRQGVREYQVKEIDPTIIFEGHTYIPVARLGKDYFKTRQEAEEALRGNVDT